MKFSVFVAGGRDRWDPREVWPSAKCHAMMMTANPCMDIGYILYIIYTIYGYWYILYIGYTIYGYWISFWADARASLLVFFGYVSNDEDHSIFLEVFWFGDFHGNADDGRDDVK